MPGKTAKVTITERQHDILRTIQNAATASSQLRQRAAIILLAFDRQGNPQIAAQVGLSRRQVSLWRRRWADAWDRLIRIECLESHAALRRAIEQVLRDEPRPGPPGKFTPEQIVQILAVACEPPEKSGRPITHWTAHELADEVVKRGIVPSISVARPRWGVISARPPCSPTRSGIGSTPPRRIQCNFRSRSRRSVTPTHETLLS